MALLSPKIRSKVGSIVSRSRRVSLTSKTIRGTAMLLDSVLLRLVWDSSVLALAGCGAGLLDASAPDGHAAPASQAAITIGGSLPRTLSPVDAGSNQVTC